MGDRGIGIGKEKAKGLGKMINGNRIRREIRFGFSYDSADNDSAENPFFVLFPCPPFPCPSVFSAVSAVRQAAL